ncbi:hypothetical protein [Streptacidiphilus sp. EB129]
MATTVGVGDGGQGVAIAVGAAAPRALWRGRVPDLATSLIPP